MLTIYLLARLRKGFNKGALLPGTSLYKKGKSMTGALVTALVRFVGFLVDSTKTSDSNEATGNAASGGILNYRTGKLDDGTDPVGWYEKD